MKHSNTRYVGLDIHKECIAVAYVSDEKDAEVLYLGRHRDPPSDIDKLIRGREPWTTAMTAVFAASPHRWNRLVGFRRVGEGRIPSMIRMALRDPATSRDASARRNPMKPVPTDHAPAGDIPIAFRFSVCPGKGGDDF